MQVNIRDWIDMKPGKQIVKDLEDLGLLIENRQAYTQCGFLLQM